MLYLGQPYSHPKSVIREVRYLAGLNACAYFHKQGICVYSPIVHWDRVALYHKLSGDTETWQHQWYGMLKRATKFAMLLLPEWEQSVGLKDEWFEANQLGLPIEAYITIEDALISTEAPLVWPSTP